MSQEKVLLAVAPKLQREFNLEETQQWLVLGNINILWSWGISKKINYANKAMLMKVNGNLFKGWVAITLAWDDTYSLYYVNENGTIRNEQHNVYCDMLRDVIDSEIEKVSEYRY